ncbi:MAG: hypothetical protein MN733_24530 [Nitrososphaera sp.]|nr:hypothetical protein [Nitrososphaera sp.]
MMQRGHMFSIDGVSQEHVAKSQGYLARYMLFGILMNPYRGYDMSSAWRDGWTEAHVEIKEQENDD